MALRDEWDEARRAEASGLDNGTRSTYLEWLMERMVLGQRVLIQLQLERDNPLLTLEPEGDDDVGTEDEDGADPQ